MDMTKAFTSAAGTHFTDARICFDRFHVMKLCGDALDQVRKQVAAEHGGLPRGAMWVLRANEANFKEKQKQLRQQICKEHGELARALSIRGFFADLWNCREEADANLHRAAVIS